MSKYNDSQKLRAKEQTKMKHEILEHYLDPWLTKISYAGSRVVYVDGFAGPGIYPDGWKGSPLRAMKKADDVLTESDSVKDRLDEFHCVFIENDRARYQDLEKHVNDLDEQVDDLITTNCVKAEFEDWARNYIAQQEGAYPDPSLFFIDPFGYGDIPFDVLSELYQLREQSYELLITFMGGKMAQWKDGPNHQKAISAALEMDDWDNRISENMSKDDQARALSELYQRKWKEDGGAEFTLPFEMFEEGKRQICYHLIHVTNHLDGLKVMKDTMFNAGADEQFAYLGPDHVGFEEEQLSFAEFGTTTDFDERIKQFANDLHEIYKNQSIEFEKLLHKTLDTNVFQVKHYREAFDILTEQKKLETHYQNPNTSQGYPLDTILEFKDPVAITDFV